MTESVTPDDGPLTEAEATRYQAREDAMRSSLVDPETGETPPLSPTPGAAKRLSVTQAYEAARNVTLDQFVDSVLYRVDTETYRRLLEGSWDVTEPDDAA